MAATSVVRRSLQWIRNGLSYWRDIETLRLVGSAVVVISAAGFIVAQLRALASRR